MRIQGICIILLVLGAFCLLGDAGANRFGRSDGNDEAIPGVLSLGADDNSALQVQKPLKEGAEMKKKSTAATDFKPKDETKYQKPKDIKSEEKLKSFMLTTTNEPSIFLPTVRPSQKENISGNGSISPFLLRGEPITENASRARALNITAPEPTNSLHANLTDLSDVSMDDEDKEMEADELPGSENATDSPNHPTFVPPKSSCRDGTKTYGIGDKVPRGCEEMCVCGEGGVVQDCKPRCVSPSFRAGRGNQDPLCEEHHLDTDGCCATLVCADSAPEPEESCIFGNKSLARGQKVEDGCSQVCLCEAGGILKCQPRCPPNDTSSGIKQHDRCVALPDPRDSCCTITLCDVSLGEHEIKSENAADLTVNIADVKVLNSTAIKLKLLSELSNGAAVEISENSHVWRQQKPDKDGVLSNLEPAHSYYVRIAEGPRTGPAIRVILPAEVIKTNITEKMDKTSCFHRGKYHKIGAEWYDECISFCMCSEGPKTECVTIECPTDFGLDVLDPHCLDWETVPPDFVPKEPQCCPQQVRCRNNGSCDYEGRTYDNWSEIPSNVTGCEKRCYCEMGKVACQAACPPVTALPPPTLQCPTNQAILMKLPGDDCCSHWVCDTTHITSGGANRFPGGFPIHGIGGYPDKMSQSSSDEIVIKAVEPLDDRTVRVVFTVPPVLVGLHGRVELRYTSEKSNHDPSTWKSQIFIPPHDLIETPQMEFDLDTLEPATEYKVRVTVNLKDIANSPSSRIYTVTTLEKHDQQTTLPPQIPIDAELQVIETNSSWVNVMWKKFTEYEMQFVDGVQLRYKEHDGKVYAATPLIHRAVTSYIIENLKPATVYEIGISIIPFPGQTTELISDKTVEIITAVEPDPYSFEVKVEIKTVKSQDVEVTWSGVPYPEDKYVNIYRAIYQSDSGKEDTSTFKIAKRDSPAKTLISDLKPGTRYRLWLEVYLTNGRIKKSNVQDFVTKPGVVLQAGVSHQGKLASIPLHEGDYYGPLVIVAILASLSILSTLILLMMLMKRRSSSKADISPRKTTSAYDNPSYKTCEDAVTITNGHNKATEHEMSTINSNNTNNTNTKETV
ncbi:putative epidermal cell surface receptor isoform X4 [Fopius arisanus]|uniref:Epidermal cell surface receptor isoform X4 n=2 Tax=Fopius arisanus TaxID=64838 RepID=A0A9R1TCM5_9HYME|nr:PREDICTED: putative epidermal cell surface receptor isoform X4 [Fopius arisanus]